MLEHILIGGIVLVLLAVGVRKFWRISSGKDAGTCSGCPGCKSSDQCPGVNELSRQDKTKPVDPVQARSERDE